MESNRVLVTGATGYIGGRLVRRLWASGRPVRAMARSPENLRSRVPSNVSVVAGDVLEPESLTGALEGIHTAYYL
ncbi:MAG: NAD(P)H-binding protein, partial [Acidobacteriota bacterium]|nr:NAD(P)H-binding protein [Acidobacteriota bacterium]